MIFAALADGFLKTWSVPAGKAPLVVFGHAQKPVTIGFVASRQRLFVAYFENAMSAAFGF